jgi:hypothetical protein
MESDLLPHDLDTPFRGQIFAHLIERSPRQPLPVPRISIRVDRGEVRRRDPNRGSVAGDAPDFGRHRHHVSEVLDHMMKVHLIKAIRAKRIGEMIEIAEDVGLARWIPVDPDRSGLLVPPTSQVQDSWLPMRL